MRLALNRALSEIKKRVIEIINLGKESVYFATKYLLEGNDEYLNKLNELEIKSDEVNLEVQDKCLVTMARQQPVAKDMRFVASMMYIASFFERICDLSQEISNERIVNISEGLKEVQNNIVWMSKKVIEMIEVVLDSLINEETKNLKEKLEILDGEIDKLFDKSRDFIVSYLKGQGEDVETAVKMIFAIRFLERIGDIVAKTGARIIYIEEGKHILIK